MATNYNDVIQQLYVAYFSRPADTAGLAYWTDIVTKANGSTVAVSAAFAAEAEYKTEYANMTNAEIVNKVYLNLFGRPAEDGGKAYWADLLDKKTITIDKVVAEISKSALNSTKAGDTDKIALQNKVIAANAFTAALDTKAEQDGYKGAAANAAAKAFLATVTTDASLAAATASGALNATVAKVVAAGTPFTLTSGLAALNNANDLKTAFLAVADGDDNPKTSTDDATINGKVTTAIAAVDALVAGDYTGSSTGVRAALLADQVTANAAALTAANKLVTDANAEIAKVAGLAAAIATKDAATTAADAAGKAVLTADADLQAKVAAYNVLNAAAVAAAADGTVAGLIELDADKKLVLKTGVTEAKNPGVTALLAATTAKEAADAALVSANKVLAAAAENVNYLDMGTAEKTDLTAIKALMTDVKVGDDALPTLAQIGAQEAVLKAQSDAGVAGAAAKLAAFQAAVATYKTDFVANTKVDALTAGNTAVKAANKSITDLTKATADLTKASDTATQLKAYNDTIAAATKAFTDNKLLAPVAAAGALVATNEADIFVAGKTDASISLFGLLGKDALYIGTQYTLNTGKVATAGNNAVLEAFIQQSGTDTKVYLEKTAFGSNAATPELVIITLVGVTATDVKLDNGIITLATSA